MKKRFTLAILLTAGFIAGAAAAFGITLAPDAFAADDGGKANVSAAELSSETEKADTRLEAVIDTQDGFVCEADGCQRTDVHTHSLCQMPECMETSVHVHDGICYYAHSADDGHAYHACGMEGCTAAEEHVHNSCGMEGCAMAGEHMHNSCGVEGCSNMKEHTHHSENGSGEGHHFRHGRGHH